MRHLDQPSSRVRWADAAAVLAVVVTVILTARQLRPLAETAAFLVRTGDPVTALPAATWPRAAAWVAISVAVLARWRTAAALGAWAAVLYEIVVVAMRVNGDPGYGGPFNVLVWPLLLAVAAALLLSVSAPVGRGLDLLGRRGRWLLAVAAAATTLTATAIPLLGDYHGPARADGVDAGFNAVFVVSSRLADAVGALTFAAVLALAAVAVLGVDRAVRRRVLALAGGRRVRVRCDPAGITPAVRRVERASAVGPNPGRVARAGSGARPRRWSGLDSVQRAATTDESYGMSAVDQLQDQRLVRTPVPSIGRGPISSPRPAVG